MCKCKYCGKEFNKKTSLNSHLATCKLNVNILKKRDSSYNSKKGWELRKEKNPYKYLKKEFILTCQKCGKLYKIITTQEKIDKNKYKKYCSRTCANGRIHSNEWKKNISTGIKSSSIFYKNNNIAVKKRVVKNYLEKRKIMKNT